jgi:hypothetical protein
MENQLLECSTTNTAMPTEHGAPKNDEMRAPGRFRPVSIQHLSSDGAADLVEGGCWWYNSATPGC